MKVFALLFLFGLAAANSEWRWENDKTYVYKYSGRLLTGLPELANHYSGIGINCTVHVDVREENTFFLTVRDAKYVRISDTLKPSYSFDGEDGSNWRELHLPEMSPVSEEYAHALSKPFVFRMRNGEIVEPRASRSEPVWSLNFKKGLALQFQTKFDSSALQVEENRIRMSGEGETYWKVKEESMQGVCETTYQVNELPRYIVKDRPELITFPEACTEEKYYGIIKTNNVDNCEKRDSFGFFQPGRFTRDITGNMLDDWTRMTQTRYIACGSRGNLVIQSIYNHLELSQNVFGLKSEKFVTGNQQVFHLREIRQTSEHIPMPSDLVNLKTMMYEHTYESYRQGIAQSIKEQGRIPEELMKDSKVISETLPRSFLAGLTPEERESEVSQEKIVSQLKELIKEIVRDTLEGEKLSEKHVGMKIRSISRGFGLLYKKEYIHRVWSELKSEFSSREEDLYTMKNIFVDTLLIGGTPECIYMLKDLILSGELSKVQISNIFIWLPQYVIAPTREVLNSLYELVTSEKVRECRFLYNSAIMGYSTLLQKVCISSYRRSNYPVHVFGEFCHPESKIVQDKWIPYLLRELKSSHSLERRNEILVSFGLLSHKHVISILTPYVEGTVENVSILNRYLALMSIGNVGFEEPSKVIPILFSVLNNPVETIDLRTAAFHMLMKLNPPTSILQKIAFLTWNTKDQELLKTINMAFLTLSMESNQAKWEEMTTSLPKKAFLIYPMIKKTPGILPTSATVYTSERLRELGAGYEQQVNWMASNSTFLPKTFYMEMKYFLGQYQIYPWSFGVRLENPDSLYYALKQFLAPKFENVENPRNKEVNQNWRELIEKLGLKTLESGPMDGAVFMRFLETSPIFYNFDKLSVNELKEKIRPFLSNPELLKEKMCGRFPLNFQRTHDISPTQYMIPSDMGFPIYLDISRPIVFSVRGEMNVECERSLPTVSLRAKVLFSGEAIGMVGTVCPFTKEIVATTIEQHSAFYLPGELNMKLDIPSHKWIFTVKPYSTSGPVEMVHFFAKPYTFYKKISDLTPISKVSSLKVIRSNEEEKTKEYTFGDYFGLNLKSKLRTESSYTDLKSCMEIFKLYNYNIWNMIRFSHSYPTVTRSGKLSLRNHEFRLEFDPSGSSTKELSFEMKFGYGSKSVNQQVQYHSIKVNDAMESNNRLPYEIVKNEVENSQVSHPRRQQKIKDILEEVEEGQAFSIIYSVFLKGSRTRSWTYQLSAFRGSERRSSEQMKHKWNMILESEHQNEYLPWKKICMKGEMDLPILPIWNINKIRNSLAHFSYQNVFGFGVNSCEESSIRITGTAKVSNKQKEHSQKSEEYKRCQQLIEKRAHGAELSTVCDITRLQAKTVDEVEFRVSYQNMPREFHVYEVRATEMLKTIFWPYMKRDSFRQPTHETREVLTHLYFHSTTPSVDVTIQRNQEKIAFEQVRIPYPLNLFFPMKAGENNAYLALETLTGSSPMPTCRIGDLEMIRFDNTTLPFHIDYCFHLLYGDCSKEHQSAIFIRNMRPGNRRELKVVLGDITILMTPSERRSEQTHFEVVRVTIEGEEMTIPVNTWKTLSFRNSQYGTIFRSSDNVIHLKAPKYYTELYFDGDQSTIFGSPYLKGKLCGLCGKYSFQEKEQVSGPERCIYSSPELQIASYHVPSHDCEMPRGVEERLQREKEECVKNQEISTKVTKSLNKQIGESCTIMKYVVLERGNQVCISKVPVNECNLNCKPAQSQVMSKNVQFTCLPQGRLADVYVQKAFDGQELPELRSRSTSFETKVDQPKHCVQIQN